MTTPGPKFLPPDDEGLAAAAAILRTGGLVALPTESSFGIAAALDRPGALERILALKERPPDSPFPVLVSHKRQAEELLGPLTGAAGQMADMHWPGPLTIVGPSRRLLHRTVLSDLGVGVRVPGMALARRLVEVTGCPITATSANLSGQPPAMTASQAAVLGGLDAVIDAPTGGGPASTVAAIRAWGLEVLRKGPVEVPKRLQVTRDSIFRGAVTIFQPQEGYRFSVDALLLAAFGAQIASKKARRLLAADLGTGCGVVALALYHWLHASSSATRRDVHIYGIELQQRLAALARLNVATSRAQQNIDIVEQDLRKKLQDVPTGRFDLVLSNPPYRRLGAGRSSPDPERALASSDKGLTIEQAAKAAASLLRPGGRAAFVFPAERTADLFAALAQAGLRPTLLRPVQAHAGRQARRVLVAADKSRPDAPLVIEPAMILHHPDGTDGPELAALLEGRVQ